MFPTESVTVHFAARQAELIIAARDLVTRYGATTARAFIDIIRGTQPDELTKKRIMSSALAFPCLLTNGNGGFTFTTAYKAPAITIEVCPNGHCKTAAFGPELPAQDSHAPPPRTR